MLLSDFMMQPLPKEMRWINKYFKTRTKKLFVKYFMIFNSTIRFCQHTGEICTERYLKKMKNQYLSITKRHSEAKKEMDFEALADIERGKYSIRFVRCKRSGRPPKNRRQETIKPSSPQQPPDA